MNRADRFSRTLGDSKPVAEERSGIHWGEDGEHDQTVMTGSTLLRSNIAAKPVWPIALTMPRFATSDQTKIADLLSINQENMMKAKPLVVASVLLIAGIGCTPSPKSGQGFTLPEGDIARGKSTYERLQCNTCHTLAGLPQLATDADGLPAAPIALGGAVHRVRTYGELVTSIIHPSHRIAPNHNANVTTDGKSRMKNYNDVMTVTELNDIVTFLSSKYELKRIEPTHYTPYGPY